MNHPRLEIDLAALVANWRMLAARAPGSAAAAVVKANAYGLGAEQVAPALVRAGCRRFYVAWPQEGVALRRRLGPGPEICVFHGFAGAEAGVFAASALQPVLNSMKAVRLWLDLGADRPPAALHVDTGMNRLGLSQSDWGMAADSLRGAHPTHLVSHLACADEPAHSLNAVQLELYRQAANLWPDARKSLAATAGVYLGEDFHFDEIRPGIGLYGGGPVPETGPAPAVVVRVLAPVLQVRRVARGATVGYGATWTASRDCVLATVGMGYADGFLRSASNAGFVALGASRCPIVGRVSMDLIIVDVTDADQNALEQVELFGPTLHLAEQALHMGTIDYEVLTRISARAERIYIGNS